MAFFNNQNRSDSLVNEGMKYYNQSNFTKALEYFREAAKLNNPAAIHNIGVCYANAQGVEYDPDEAYRWTERAAEMGFPLSCFNAAIYNAEGFGTDFHMGKAVRYINTALEADPYNQSYLNYQQHLASSDPNVLRANALVNRGFYFSQKGRHQDANRYYEIAAGLNQPQAMINLSVSYDQGLGVAVDRVRGFEWMKKAADLGNAYACFYVAKKFHDGDGCLRNMDQAIFYSQWASQLEVNNADYRNQLIQYQNEKPKETTTGEMIDEANRLNDEGRLKEAFDLMHKAADLGNAIALYNMGVYYRIGAGTEIDENKAFEYLKRSAEGGFPMAFPLMRDHYYFGRVVNRDLEEAIYWGKKAADAYPEDQDHKRNLELMRKEYQAELSGMPVNTSGNTSEEDRLGEMVNRSINLNKEGRLEESFQLMKEAADQNFPLALFNMNIYYDIGAGVKEDKEKAFEYLKKAAEADFVPAYAMLAEHYYYGKGTDIDLKEAMRWQEKSIEASPDDQELKQNLEVIRKECEALLNGKSIEEIRTRPEAPSSESDRRVNEAFALLNEERYEEAYDILMEEAEKGNPYAMRNLSSMYMNGNFVEKNEKAAFEWMRRSAELGLAESCYQLANKYHFARGVIRDLGNARAWVEKAVELDPTIEEYQRFCNQVKETTEEEYLAVLFQDGMQYFNQNDYANAYLCFEKGALAGHGNAMHNLASMLYYGQGCVQDLKASFEWEKRSAESGYFHGYYGLYERYRNGYGTDRDLLKAAECIRIAHELAPENLEIANAYARFMNTNELPEKEEISRFMGSAYTYEESTQIYEAAKKLWISKKYKEALEQLIPIARNGDRRALHYIGIAYYNGYGIEKDLTKADRFFTAAALRGHFPSRSYLSKRFNYGQGASAFKLYNYINGVEYDGKTLANIRISETAEHLREGLYQYQKKEKYREVYELNKILSYGNPDVYCSKAENLLNMGKNDEAMRHLSFAAILGHSYALYKLGYLLQDDPKLSEYCFKAASERGYKAADYLY